MNVNKISISKYQELKEKLMNLVLSKSDNPLFGQVTLKEAADHFKTSMEGIKQVIEDTENLDLAVGVKTGLSGGLFKKQNQIIEALNI